MKEDRGFPDGQGRGCPGWGAHPRRGGGGTGTGGRPWGFRGAPGSGSGVRCEDQAATFLMEFHQTSKRESTFCHLLRHFDMMHEVINKGDHYKKIKSKKKKNLYDSEA